MWRTLVLAMLTATLCACSATADKAAAESGVAQFHRMLANGEYDAIYSGAANEFRQSGSRESAVRFLRTVHERLGAMRRIDQQGWRVNFVSGGNIVNMRYATEFARGRGTEDFVFRVNGGSAQLVGYHINSTDLMPTVPDRPEPVETNSAKH